MCSEHPQNSFETVNMEAKSHRLPHIYIYLSCGREKTQWQDPQYESDPNEAES